MRTCWPRTRRILPSDFVDTHFAFFGTTVRGTPENQPRWKRGVRLVESALGESLGRLYVAKYFPPESKARMDALVEEPARGLPGQHRRRSTG